MYYRKAEVRRAGIQFRDSLSSYPSLRKSAREILTEAMRVPSTETFNVFLSHSYEDAEIILGVKKLIEKQGKTVYVDWVTDNSLDRSNVNATTAEILRKRMRSCDTLIYASSPNASESRWMPWELGFFDGLRAGLISIFPLVETSDYEWKGQEYLGLYPLIKRLDSSGVPKPFVVRKDSSAQPLSRFGVSDHFIWNEVNWRAN